METPLRGGWTWSCGWSRVGSDERWYSWCRRKRKYYWTIADDMISVFIMGNTYHFFRIDVLAIFQFGRIWELEFVASTKSTGRRCSRGEGTGRLAVGQVVALAEDY